MSSPLILILPHPPLPTTYHNHKLHHNSTPSQPNASSDSLQIMAPSPQPHHPLHPTPINYTFPQPCS